MAVKWFLDCRRVDVVSATDNQLLLPAGEPEITVGVATADVSGIEPAAAVTQFHPDPAILFRPRIAAEHVGTGNHQLARFVHSAVTQVPSVFVDDHGLHRLTG